MVSIPQIVFSAVSKLSNASIRYKETKLVFNSKSAVRYKYAFLSLI